MKNKGMRYLKWSWMIILAISATAAVGWIYLEVSIPKHMNVVIHEQEGFHFMLPFEVTISSDSEAVVLQNQSRIPDDEIRLKADEPFTLCANRLGNYHLDLKLFGKFLFREIQVDVVDVKYAIPCGVPVGIYLKSRGVMVIGTGHITTKNGEKVEPAYGVLQSGDYIEAINGKPLRDKEALITDVNASEGRNMLLRVRREGRQMDISMTPIKDQDGKFKLGAWVRDDTQGIGTLTYIDMNGKYGALGHGIGDADTGQVVEIEGGELYQTDILGIERGTSGTPGVMEGVIFYGPGTCLGKVESNSDVGIYGTANEKMKKEIAAEPVEIGYRQMVHKGPAVLRSSVSGTVEEYDIEIQKVEQNPMQKNKGMVLRVTDSRLLELTGGIIQGMSGSPILQDGKLIGAVTHVLVNDPTRGYGIFIENMIEH